MMACRSENLLLSTATEKLRMLGCMSAASAVIVVESIPPLNNVPHFLHLRSAASCVVSAYKYKDCSQCNLDEEVSVV